jgi:hypothetical protein
MNIHQTVRWFCDFFFRALAVGVTVIGTSCGEANAMARTPGFYQMIQTLIDSPQLDRQTVEQAIGIRLLPVPFPPGFDPYAKRYEARERVIFDDVTIGVVEYNEPPRDAKNLGPRVSISVAEGCITEADLRARYENLETIFLEPGARIELEEKGGWGTLRFGFARQSLDCVSYVVVTRKPDGAF